MGFLTSFLVINELEDRLLTDKITVIGSLIFIKKGRS